MTGRLTQWGANGYFENPAPSSAGPCGPSGLAIDVGARMPNLRQSKYSSVADAGQETEQTGPLRALSLSNLRRYFPCPIERTGLWFLAGMGVRMPRSNR